MFLLLILSFPRCPRVPGIGFFCWTFQNCDTTQTHRTLPGRICVEKQRATAWGQHASLHFSCPPGRPSTHRPVLPAVSSTRMGSCPCLCDACAPGCDAAQRCVCRLRAGVIRFFAVEPDGTNTQAPLLCDGGWAVSGLGPLWTALPDTFLQGACSCVSRESEAQKGKNSEDKRRAWPP